MNNVMIDIETLGTSAGCSILSIAAVQFDAGSGKTGQSYLQYIHRDSNLDFGLTEDLDTIRWWENQPLEAQADYLKAAKINLDTALIGLCEFIDSLPEDVLVWANGSSFDLPIIKAALDKVGLSLPWEYYNERCVRTIASLLPAIKKETVFTGVKHNPYFDCLHQIKYTVRTLNRLAE